MEAVTPFGAGIWSNTTGRSQNNQRWQKQVHKAKTVAASESDRGFTRTSGLSRCDNKSDTERRPRPLWRSATHILTAHHSSRPLVGQIVNPISKGYMGLLMCHTCLFIKPDTICFAISFTINHDICIAALIWPETSDREQSPDFWPIFSQTEATVLLQPLL